MISVQLAGEGKIKGRREPWLGICLPDVGDDPAPQSHPLFRVMADVETPKGARMPVWRRLPMRPEFAALPEMAKNLLRFAMWVEMGHCKIIDRDNPGMPVPLRFRPGQWMVWEAMMRQALAGRPVRILVPKYRRHGISTFFQCLFVFMAETIPYRNYRTAAHTESSALNIFQIAKLCYTETGHRLSKEREDKKTIKPAGMNSTYQCVTGAGTFTGSGDTIHGLHVSELAKFANATAQDARALHSMVNAVSQTSLDTIVVIESSGQGPEGEFPQRCLKAAAGEGSYEVVFLPWTLDTSLGAKVPPVWNPPLGGEELLAKMLYGATDEQLAWRRQKLVDDFWKTTGGGTKEDLFWNAPPEFGWDYPITLEQCFGQKSGRCYPGFEFKKHCTDLPGPDFWGPNSYCTRFVDWGGSENHAFVCLWARVDPDRPPGLKVDAEKCPMFVKEHQGYARDGRTGKPIKMNDDTCDAFRYGVSSLSLQCFVYVYRELYETNPQEAVHTKIVRRIHQMSGWIHPSGDPNDLDISAYEPGPNADRFKWGGRPGDERHTYESYKAVGLAHEFREAIRMGAGVADASQYRNCLQFTQWGVPLVPHVKPLGPTKEGDVADGIALVNLLIEGNALPSARPEKTETQRLVEIQSRRRQDLMLTDEEAKMWGRFQGQLGEEEEVEENAAELN